MPYASFKTFKNTTIFRDSIEVKSIHHNFIMFLASFNWNNWSAGRTNQWLLTWENCVLFCWSRTLEGLFLPKRPPCHISWSCSSYKRSQNNKVRCATQGLEDPGNRPNNWCKPWLCVFQKKIGIMILDSKKLTKNWPGLAYLKGCFYLFWK